MDVFDIIFFFKQKTAYEVRISDWSSDVCSSDLMRLAGGGLPEAAIRLKRRPADGAVSGQIFMKDYIAGNARLGLEPVRFVATGRGTSHFTTALHLTGPLPGGGLKGLTLPIDGLLGTDGTVRVNSACTPLEFMALKYESLTLGKTRLRLCPVDGAIVTAGPRGFSLRAAVRAPNLKGKLGQNPLQLAATDIQFEAPEGGFAANGLKVVLGTQDAPTVLELTRLTGSFATPLSGTLE